jgi:hypothetical protein
MNVSAILRQKGRAVTTAHPDTTLLEIANKLAAKRIGAIVVVGAGGEICGIVSERDVIRALATSGASCLKEPLAQTMTRQVVSCLQPPDDLLAMMTARRFRICPWSRTAPCRHRLHRRCRQASRGRGGDGRHGDAGLHHAQLRLRGVRPFLHSKHFPSERWV